MKKKINISPKQYEKISRIYRFGGFALILGLLIWFSYLIGKPIEFIMVFLPYFVTKNFYSNQYHSKSLKHCFILSFIVFSIATLAVIPRIYSIIFSVFFGCCIAFISYKAGVIQHKLEDLEEIKK